MIEKWSFDVIYTAFTFGVAKQITFFVCFIRTEKVVLAVRKKHVAAFMRLTRVCLFVCLYVLCPQSTHYRLWIKQQFIPIVANRLNVAKSKSCTRARNPSIEMIERDHHHQLQHTTITSPIKIGFVNCSFSICPQNLAWLTHPHSNSTHLWDNSVGEFIHSYRQSISRHFTAAHIKSWCWSHSIRYK